MHVAAGILGVLVFAGVLVDAFQTIILPRRPVGRLRITRIFFLTTWVPWGALTRCFIPRRQREQVYSIYGPLALLLLFALWAFLLVSSFALFYFSARMPLTDPWHPATEWLRLRACYYFSASSLFTLGLGDVLPATHMARLFAVCEAGCGLGFVALVIGYVPVLYTAFSTREVLVALLDARAGSPPTAAELLVRHSFPGGHEALTLLLAEWERWCAEVLETHVSYPILCYYRSQHDNQSWLSALTSVLDTCALLITTIEGPATRQAQLTFAIGRHVLVDIGHVFHREKDELRLREAEPTRLGDAEYGRLREALAGAGVILCKDHEAHTRLVELRKLYEPNAEAMAAYLRFDLPLWAPLPPDPSRKPTLWAAVSQLRSPAATQDDRYTQLISPESTATHLEDGD